MEKYKIIWVAVCILDFLVNQYNKDATLFGIIQYSTSSCCSKSTASNSPRFWRWKSAWIKYWFNCRDWSSQWIIINNNSCWSPQITVQCWIAAHFRATTPEQFYYIVVPVRVIEDKNIKMYEWSSSRFSTQLTQKIKFTTNHFIAQII